MGSRPSNALTWSLARWRLRFSSCSRSNKALDQDAAKAMARKAMMPEKRSQ